MQNNNGVIKANKKYAGQLCNICKKEIEFGETIHLCPNCQSINHEECWQNEGGCNTLSCNSLSSKSRFGNNNRDGGSNNNGSLRDDNLSLDDFEIQPFKQSNNRPVQRTFGANTNNFANNRNMNVANGRSNMGEGTPTNMVACRWCKEPIVRGTRKCPHCGEFQSDADRKKIKDLEDSVSDEDRNIPGGTWAVIVLLPDIAFIVGFVFLFTKPIRGLKMMLASVVCFVIRVLLYVALHSN